MWRITIPQLAYQHEFLIHALLACSTLHMAHLHPDRRSELTIKATTYQDHAMSAFRAAVSGLESETCDAVLVFARLVAITAFALDERIPMAGGTEDELPSWLFFSRSGCK